MLGGRVVELTAESMTLETPGGAQTQLRLGDTPRLARLESGGRELLQPGVAVMVKLGETGRHRRRRPRGIAAALAR